jgi:hypothetical protein
LLFKVHVFPILDGAQDIVVEEFVVKLGISPTYLTKIQHAKIAYTVNVSQMSFEYG